MSTEQEKKARRVRHLKRLEKQLEAMNKDIERVAEVHPHSVKTRDAEDAKTETINHPPHYGGDTVYEAIKVIEAWELDFCLGNTVKYISRAGKKDREKEIEDLKKAQWYLARRVEQLEKAAKFFKENHHP